MPLPASTQRLVAALEKENSPKLGAILKQARHNEFHDYLSESATPIMNLVVALEKAGFRALANRARNGEFDATRQESDDWRKSDEGQAAFAEFFAGLNVPEDTKEEGNAQ